MQCLCCVKLEAVLFEWLLMLVQLGLGVIFLKDRLTFSARVTSTRTAKCLISS